MIVARYAGQALHDPLDDDARVTSGKLTLEVNAAGSLSFTLPMGHPLYGGIELMRPDREVTVTDGEREIFRGRVTAADSAGMDVISYTCEGQLAYLNDTLVRPYGTYEASSEHGEKEWETIAPREANAYAEWLIAQHAEADAAKAFRVVANQLPATTITRSSTVWPSVSDEIKEKVLEHFDAYIVAGSSAGARTLSILTQAPECSQRIEFGANLTDYARNVRYDDAVSVVVPYANAGDDEVTLAGLADGPVSQDCTKQGDRIVCLSSVSQMGYVETRRSFEAASSSAHLARLAAEWLEGKRGAVDSLTIKAVDLSRIEPDIQPIGLLDSVRVISRPHGVDQRLTCVQIDIDLTSPAQSIYTFGALRPSLVRGEGALSRAAQSAIDDAVESLPPIRREAKAAAASAAVKKRVFTARPTPPYDAGDLWVQGETGGILVCKTSRKE